MQGAAQAATAACVLTGTGGVGAIVVLQAVYGIGLGLVLPAEVGLVPQTVSPARLQQANALQGLSRNMIGVLGPAIGGVVVVASSPGIALAIDAVSFLVCADLLRRIRVAPRDASGSHGFVHELREGWQEFTRGRGSGPRCCSSGSATSRSPGGSSSARQSRTSASAAPERGR